ncbi:MAG: hypothetical protein IH941_01155 [Acidobacteria bacterium]|nr:hypothetical protein [Acidobacteriota bacterium]
MKRFVAMFSVMLLVSLPAMASAQTVSDVVSDLDDGVYVADGLSVDEGAIHDAVNRARNAGIGLSVVLLDENPGSGATAFADSVLRQLGTGTVLVLSASNEGMSSSEIDQSAIEAALDTGFAAGGGDVGYVDAVVDSITGSGGSFGFIVLLVIVGGLVLLVWWAIRRSDKASKKRRGDLVGEARDEIKAQLDAMANTILEISDLVSASSSGEDNQYLEKAGATYSTALESYEEANDLRALEDLSDRLDEARWQLDAAAAISEGRPAPDKPEKNERPVCFFDPTHRDATEMADIETSSGKRTIRVCRADAERLRRGSQPEPRMIKVGGRRVPAPMAPRSHGGGGMDWLETFSMMAGGVGQAASYDWGGSRRAGRGTGRSSGGGASPRSKGGRARAGRSRRRRR